MNTLYDYVRDMIEGGTSPDDAKKSFEQAMNDALAAKAECDKLDIDREVLESRKHGKARTQFFKDLAVKHKLTSADLSTVLLYFLIDEMPLLDGEIKSTNEWDIMVMKLTETVDQEVKQTCGFINMMGDLAKRLDDIAALKAKVKGASTCDCGKCDDSSKKPMKYQNDPDFKVVTDFLSSLR